MSWQPIETMPIGVMVLVAEGDVVKPGTRIDDVTVAAPFLMNLRLWTHWMPMPSPPAWSRHGQAEH